jgi:LacI family transcriptional regulator
MSLKTDKIRSHPLVRKADEPVTLRRIARETGVSVATVSRALRQPATVSPQKRQRILELVKRYRYVPDALAASFSSRRTGLVGLIVPTISNSIYAEFTEAVQGRLQAAGRKLLIANTNYSAELETQIIQKLVESRVEGVVLTGYRRDPAIFELLRHYSIPFVVTWSTSPDPDVPAISFDNRAAAAAATETLIGLGHRRIGLICGVSAVNDRAAQRLEAYREVLARHRIRFSSALVDERPFEMAEGAAAAAAMMRLASPPTALFCANDIQALGAMFACQRLGLRVPDDISIIGFDDLPMASIVYPSLSTVHVPAKEMGEAAADALVSSVESGKPIPSILIETRVIIRDSAKALARRSG